MEQCCNYIERDPVWSVCPECGEYDDPANFDCCCDNGQRVVDDSELVSCPECEVENHPDNYDCSACDCLLGGGEISNQGAALFSFFANKAKAAEKEA